MTAIASAASAKDSNNEARQASAKIDLCWLRRRHSSTSQPVLEQRVATRFSQKSVKDVCREKNIVEQACYRWKRVLRMIDNGSKYLSFRNTDYLESTPFEHF